MNPSDFPKTGQRLTFSTPHTDSISNQENPAIPANADDIAKDNLGFTNPNLHRRIRVNVMQQNGKKIYTIAEPFTTGETGTVYETKYPIQEMKFVYISGSSVWRIIQGHKRYWVYGMRLDGDNSFHIDPEYIRQYDMDHPDCEISSGLPMEVIYETTPLIDDEVAYREYELAISGVHSYRTTKMFLHTEADEGDREHRVYENEIP